MANIITSKEDTGGQESIEADGFGNIWCRSCTISDQIPYSGAPISVRPAKPGEVCSGCGKVF